MTITREEVAAYADGELDEGRREEVRAAVEADPALAAEVAAHLKLKRKLSLHFAPLVEAPAPDRFADMLRPEDEPQVSDLAAARAKREVRQKFSGVRWGWIAGPALAASLALAVFLPRGGGTDYASGELAAALDRQLVATQAVDAGTRILLSFRNEAGEYCRAYAGAAEGGIACRQQEGWHVVERFAGSGGAVGEYRQAGSGAVDVMARAQEMAAGPALTAREEAAARNRGWR